MNETAIIKICGLTQVADAVLATELGATAIGLNFDKRSKRHVAVEVARSIVREVPGHVLVAGVFVDLSAEEIAAIAHVVNLRWLQLHFEATPALAIDLERRDFRVLRCFGWNGIATLRIARQFVDQCDALQGKSVARWLLLDAPPGALPGGTGCTWNWQELADAALPGPWILAGGLSPENVANAIAVGRPTGVDVASGVESEPGKKDAGKLREFIQNARAAFANSAS